MARRVFNGAIGKTIFYYSTRRYYFMVSENIILVGLSSESFENGNFYRISYSNVKANIYIRIEGDFLKFMIDRCMVNGLYDHTLLNTVVEELIANANLNITFRDQFEDKCEFDSSKECRHECCQENTYELIIEVPKSLKISRVKSAR